MEPINAEQGEGAAEAVKASHALLPRMQLANHDVVCRITDTSAVDIRMSRREQRVLAGQSQATNDSRSHL